MPRYSWMVFGLVGFIALLMVAILGFHVGGQAFLKIGDYSPLVGAFTGGILALISVNIPFSSGERTEPWLARERIAWNLIGCGCIAWAIGECFWRYYLAQGESPFPSLADLGYSSLPPLFFAGLIIQPFSKSNQKRVFLVLDSLISMGALLSIGWFLLLGSLAQQGSESFLEKFLGLYYPVADIALFSCIIFLLLRGPNNFYRARARRIGLLVVGIGLVVFALSDFNFNIQQNLGTFVEESFADLGWPLGMMIVGVAAYLRRFLPRVTDRPASEGREQEGQQFRFGPWYALPYILLAFLFAVLVFNILSSDPGQQSIRPVLLIATVIVTGLVVVRQVVTILENEHLVTRQSTTLKQLEMVYLDIEKRQASLEAGVTHLKEVQTRLANGDVGARVQIVNNDLWPLAAGMNLMADRMMRAEHIQKNSQKLAKALSDFDQALKRKRDGGPFVIPLSCVDIPEMHSLIWTLGLGSAPASPGTMGNPRSPSHPIQHQSGSLSQGSFSESSTSSFYEKSSASPLKRKTESIGEKPRFPQQLP